MILVRKRKRKAKRHYLFRELVCPRRSPYVSSINKKPQRARFLENLSGRVTTLPGETNLEAAGLPSTTPEKSVSARGFSQRKACGGAPKYPLRGQHLEPAFQRTYYPRLLDTSPGAPKPFGHIRAGPPTRVWPRSLARVKSKLAQLPGRLQALHLLGSPVGSQPIPYAARGCRVRKEFGQARLPSVGESDLAKNRTARHPTTSGAFFTTRQVFTRNLQAAPQQGSTHKKDPTTRPSALSSPSLLRPYSGPLDCRHLFPRQTRGWGDWMTPDTPSVL